MIVVDVGCQPHGPEESVHKLIDRFHPEIMFGFDPWPSLEEGIERIENTVVLRRRLAAWTDSCTLPLTVDGITTGIASVDEYADAVDVHAFDLGEFLSMLPLDRCAVVVKLDAEGAEYELLPDLVARGIDGLLSLVLVEWHPPETSHGMFTESRPALRCPIEEWA